MKTISEIEPNVDLLAFGERKIYLIGTAHVSRQSAELVERIIRDLEPDVVCVELCQPRYLTLENPESWRETDIFQIIKAGKVYLLFAQLVLASFQKRLAAKLGIEPGEEMRRAIAVSKEKGIEVAVVDREIRTTLKRAWAKASIWSIAKVLISMIASLFESEEISEEEIERLKEGDALASIMLEFSDVLPGVKDALIDERDQYMAAKIYAAEGTTVVAVVGAGHVPGIKREMGGKIDIASLEKIPSSRMSLKLIAWGVPLIIISMFIYGFVGAGAETSYKMILAWVLANGVLSAIGALIALAHPLTILTALVAAPITSLNPTIAAGWVCGLVEAYLRKPRVKDLETIADDVSTVRGFWSNRLSKILLVVFFANIGSVIGTIVGSVKVASYLP